MLTITFLGVGGAFAKRNFQSNALIEAWAKDPGSQNTPDDNLLVDFGSTAPLALHQLKDVNGFEYLNNDGRIHFSAIRRVFISHQHADHVGGLEEMAFANRFLHPSTNAESGYKPQLISDARILLNLWDHSLRGGLGTLEGQRASLDDYFNILALQNNAPENAGFQLLNRYDFSVFHTDHLCIQQKHDWPSLGLHITDSESGETAFFSGDTKYDYAAYGSMMRKSKINFHDVQLQNQPDPVHALLSELREMPEDVRQKTYLYHYDDSWDDKEYRCVNDQFAGFVIPQKRYVIFN